MSEDAAPKKTRSRADTGGLAPPAGTSKLRGEEVMRSDIEMAAREGLAVVESHGWAGLIKRISAATTRSDRLTGLIRIERGSRSGSRRGADR